MNSLNKTHIIPEGTPEQRLDAYACTVFDSLPSKKSAYKAVKRGELLADGKTCAPFQRIVPGQRLDLAHNLNKGNKRFRLLINVAYEDEHLAVIDKPPGFPVNGNRFKTIENALPCNLKASPRADSLAMPKPVHRLDSRTGGLLVIAKTQSAAIELSRQFRKREIYKGYRAVIIGRLEGAGRISEPIDGRDAVTEYMAAQHAPSLKNGWLTLVDLKPLTGRTHQLRRHLAGIGFPVLGDDMYGIKGMILKGKGLFLYSVLIAFRHPHNGEDLSISIAEPARFKKILAREERRWLKYNTQSSSIIRQEG